MVSVASLLNPEPPRAPLPTSRPVPVVSARPTVSFQDQQPPARPSIETPPKMAQNAKPVTRCKAKGVVNFPPFEVLDEAALREVRRFQVHPLGSIQGTSRRIPYNSGKKDFFSKTGREFFEVFQYDFRLPGDDNPYTIMWDYSVGLVRMTPFFKCRGYSKTTPAKMLSQNPGLKDITYSITGGAIKAQGYWMPFSCAKAVCSTFCQKIAGALIPLFGPDFPFECIPEKATGHGRMIIDPEIVLRAKRDSAAFFTPHPSLPSPRPSRSISPRPQRSARRAGPYDYRSEYERQLLLSPYVTDTDVDSHPRPEPYGRPMYPPMSLRAAGRHVPIAQPPTPLHSPGWAAVNQPYYPTYHPRSTSNPPGEPHPLNMNPTANPWLSAVPRPLTPTPNSGRYPLHHASPSTSFPERALQQPRHGAKRDFDQVGTVSNDDGYDAGESNHSQAGSSPRADGQDQASSDDDGDDGVKLPAPPPSPVTSKMVNYPHPHSILPPTQQSIGRMACYTDNERRASERDAAMMLMHMRGCDSSGDEMASKKEDGDAHEHREEGCFKDGVAGKGDDIDTKITKIKPSSSYSPPPVAVEVGIHTRTTTGPNTRSKRRKTLM